MGYSFQESQNQFNNELSREINEHPGLIYNSRRVFFDLCE